MELIECLRTAEVKAIEAGALVIAEVTGIALNNRSARLCIRASYWNPQRDEAAPALIVLAGVDEKPPVRDVEPNDGPVLVIGNEWLIVPSTNPEHVKFDYDEAGCGSLMIGPNGVEGIIVTPWPGKRMYYVLEDKTLRAQGPNTSVFINQWDVVTGDGDQRQLLLTVRATGR